MNKSILPVTNHNRKQLAVTIVKVGTEGTVAKTVTVVTVVIIVIEVRLVTEVTVDKVEFT